VSYSLPYMQFFACGQARQNSFQISLACSRCSCAVKRGSRRSIKIATFGASDKPSPRRIGPTPRFAHHFQPFVRLRSSARASSDCDTAISVLATWIVKSIGTAPPAFNIISRSLWGACQIVNLLIGPIRADSGADALQPKPTASAPRNNGAARGMRSPLSASPQIQIPTRNDQVPNLINSASGAGEGRTWSRSLAHYFGDRP
jgi:hypothetical protein